MINRCSFSISGLICIGVRGRGIGLLRSIEITSSLLPLVDAELAKKLTKKVGKDLDEVVRNLDKDPKSLHNGPLHSAALNNHLKMCKMLVKEYNCDTNSADVEGMALCFCCDFCPRFLGCWARIGCLFRRLIACFCEILGTARDMGID